MILALLWIPILPANTASVSGNNLWSKADPDGDITVTYDVSDGTTTTQNTRNNCVNDAPTINPLTNGYYSFDLLQVDGWGYIGFGQIVFTDKDGNEVPLPTAR